MQRGAKESEKSSREMRRRENVNVYSELIKDGTVEVFELLRRYVAHEDELVHQRTTWFLTLNSFLFASIALVLSAEAAPPYIAEWQVSLFFILVGIAGLTSSVTASYGIWAAYSSTKAIKDLWVDKYEPLSKDFNASTVRRQPDEDDFEDIKTIRFRNDPTRPLPYLKGGGGRYRIASRGRYVAISLPIVIGISWLLFLAAFAPFW